MYKFIREKYLVWHFNGLNKSDDRWGPGAVVKGHPFPMDVVSFCDGIWLVRGVGGDFEVTTDEIEAIDIMRHLCGYD